MSRRFIIVLFFLMMAAGDALSQCAMCRTSLENNFSNGSPGIAAGINTGILYLLILPYIAVITISYFWFKYSRNAETKLGRGAA
jgi:hypothetical protein